MSKQSSYPKFNFNDRNRDTPHRLRVASAVIMRAEIVSHSDLIGSGRRFISRDYEVAVACSNKLLKILHEFLLSRLID